MSKSYQDQAGFTLIEMLIVVIILGILAAIIIPQLSVSTEDAKISTLKTNLGGLRSSIEIYYAQHNNYPGANDITGTATSDAATAKTAFVQQLTQYTESDGTVSATKTGTAKYGPYVKGGGLPKNPFNESSDVVCNATEDNITIRVWDGTGTVGWHFYTQTGVLVANDSTEHAAY
jgi:prepilin-type N-terminal cleavage/methylation domain-containing protein